MTAAIKLFYSTQESIYVASLPDFCPRCRFDVEPVSLGAYKQLKGNNAPELFKKAEAIFRCPRHKCDSLFIVLYQQKNVRDSEYSIVNSFPWSISPLNIPSKVKKLVPTFVNIFQEAHAAEERGLSLIAGGGYRKALEFLIKDFCIHNLPNNQEKDSEIKKINKLFLKPVIDKYVDDPDIKIFAHRTSWLGNDELHYKRIWENKDLKDLKELLELTIYFIEKKIRAEEILSEMSEKPNNL